MFSGEKEIPKYYDFNYLLKPALPMEDEYQEKLLDEFAPSCADRNDIIISCAIAAFAMQGDIMFSKDVSFAPQVATEKTMDRTTLELQKMTNSKLSEYVKDKTIGYPQAGMNYKKLYNFEMFLLRQKKMRRERKRQKG